MADELQATPPEAWFVDPLDTTRQRLWRGDQWGDEVTTSSGKVIRDGLLINGDRVAADATAWIRPMASASQTEAPSPANDQVAPTAQVPLSVMVWILPALAAGFVVYDLVFRDYGTKWSLGHAGATGLLVGVAALTRRTSVLGIAAGMYLYLAIAVIVDRPLFDVRLDFDGAIIAALCAGAMISALLLGRRDATRSLPGWLVGGCLGAGGTVLLILLLGLDEWIRVVIDTGDLPSLLFVVLALSCAGVALASAVVSRSAAAMACLGGFGMMLGVDSWTSRSFVSYGIEEFLGTLGHGISVALGAGLAVAAVVAGGVQTPRSNPAALSTASAPGSVGVTASGDAVYPIVGYTADRMPVYADQMATPVGFVQDRTNVLAILTLIFGILGGCVAIPLGHVARYQIRRTGERGKGMATAGLVLGYLWLAIGVAYYVFLFAAFSNTGY